MAEILNKEMLGALKEVMEEDFSFLLETFLVESEKQFCQARQAWQAQDYDVLRRAAHSLKGSCGNIGAEILQATCADLEYKAKDSAPVVIPDLLACAETQLADLQAAVKTYL